MTSPAPWASTVQYNLQLLHKANKRQNRHETAFDPDFMGEDLAYWDSMDEFFSHFTKVVGP